MNVPDRFVTTKSHIKAIVAHVFPESNDEKRLQNHYPGIEKRHGIFQSLTIGVTKAHAGIYLK
jgi:hypothetical protein